MAWLFIESWLRTCNYRYTDAASSPNTATTRETYTPNNTYETSVSYVATRRFTDRVSLFGEAGAGAVGFASMESGVRSTPASFFLTYRKNTFRPEGIAGLGFDYRLFHGTGLRAEYRGLFVKYPDFASAS